MEHTDGLHGAMSELMKRQKCLMMKNHHISCSKYLQLKVIHHNHSSKGCQFNLFCIWSISLFMSGRILFHKECYDNTNTIKHTTNPDSIVSFFNLENQKLKYILQNKHDYCSCYVANYQLM